MTGVQTCALPICADQPLCEAREIHHRRQRPLAVGLRIAAGVVDEHKIEIGTGGQLAAAQLAQRQHREAARAVDYLRSRGLSGEIAAAFGLGFAPPGWDNLLGALGGRDAERTLMARAGLLVEKSGGGYYNRFRDRDDEAKADEGPSTNELLTEIRDELRRGRG